MIIENRLDWFTGKFAKVPAVLVIIVGCLTIKKIWPVIFILSGLFLLFTHSGIRIDTEKKRLFLYDKLFGILKVGQSLSLEKYVGLLLTPYRRYYRFLSLSNRSTSVEENGFGIYLVDQNKKPSILIKRCKTIDDAHRRIDEFSLWLKMPVFTIK